MNSTWELKEKSTGTLKVTVEGQVWSEAQDKAFKKLASKVSVPGFRAGKVPTAMVKKYISAQEILFNAVDLVATDALVAGVEEHKIELIARPELDIEAIDEKSVTLVFNLQVKPEVKLGEYTNLGIKKESTRVLKKDVEQEVTRLQEKFAEEELKEEGTVENGDIAVIDFEGFKDGVPFDGGKGVNHPLVIGSGQFIPGFEEQVIGMATGETKDLEVSFPENYHVADLAGQPVVFKVTVNEIKTKVLPEYNDELVQMLKLENVTTVEQYEEYLKENIKKQKEVDAENNYANECLAKVVENATVEIPQVLIDEEINRMVEDFKNRFAQQGVSFEMYSQITGQTEETLREQMAEDAENQVRARLVLEAVAEVENIEVSEERIEKEMNEIATRFNMDVEEVKKHLPVENVIYDIKIREASEVIKRK